MYGCVCPTCMHLYSPCPCVHAHMHTLKHLTHIRMHTHPSMSTSLTNMLLSAVFVLFSHIFFKCLFLFWMHMLHEHAPTHAHTYTCTHTHTQSQNIQLQIRFHLFKIDGLVARLMNLIKVDTPSSILSLSEIDRQDAAINREMKTLESLVRGEDHTHTYVPSSVSSSGLSGWSSFVFSHN